MHKHYLKEIKPKTKTKEEKDYHSKVAQLPCGVCGSMPVQVHHKTGGGMALKSSHYDVMPLCHNHHMGREGIHQIGVKTWEDKFEVTQDKLIERTKKMIKFYF